MNISSQIFGTNSSDHNSSEVENRFDMTFFVTVFTILLSFPTNTYVIWLIVTGTGNGLVAEFFSLNLAVCEILICVDCLLFILKHEFQALCIVVQFLEGFPITSRPLFQCLMCVERYLAVVHPVTFLKYKPLRYRMICSVIVWVAGLVSSGVHFTTLFLYLITLNWVLMFVQILFFFSIQLFCFLSVLRALKQSGPGERKREKEENHMKRTAFYLILKTNVTLYIFYALYIIFTALYFRDDNEAFIAMSYASFTLISLVQPFSFFYRVGKIPFMKCQ